MTSPRMKSDSPIFFGFTSELRRGFTIVEVAVASLIVGVVIVPSVFMMSAVAQSYFRSAERDHAFLAAESLLAEIQSLEFDDPELGETTLGPESGESSNGRFDFDDIDDFKDWTETSLTRRDGSPLPNLESFTRTVSVNYVSFNNNEIVRSTQPTRLKLITVEVTNSLGVSISLSTVRSKNGILEQPTLRTLETSRSFSLSVTGSKIGECVNRTDLFNQKPSP